MKKSHYRLSLGLMLLALFGRPLIFVPAHLHGDSGSKTDSSVAGAKKTTKEVAPRKPSLPFEDWGACPFECCMYREWIANRNVDILRSRNPKAKVAFSLKQGEKVQALTGVVITNVAGLIEVVEEKIVVSDPDIDQPALEFHKGDKIYILTPEALGYYKIWLRGKLIGSLNPGRFGSKESCSNAFAGCGAYLIQTPQSQWWIKIKKDNGKIGWVRMDGDVGLFDNIDVCG